MLQNIPSETHVRELVCFQKPAATDGVGWVSSIVASSTAYYNISTTGTTPGWIEYDMWLPAGTYTPYLYWMMATNSGIAELLVDGVSIGATFDGYSATAGWGYGVVESKVTFPIDGWHKVRIRKTGTKRAASSNYQVNFASVLFAKVAQ